MNTTGKVFNLLVAGEGTSLLGKDKTVDDLSEGQIGVFNANTNVSLDATNVGDVRDIYFAVKNKDRVRFSAGQHIQTPLIIAMTQQVAMEGQNHVVDILDYNAECETDYAVKIEFRSGLINQRMGYTPYTKTYAVKTGCCDPCETDDCISGNKYELTKLLIDAINADTDGFVTAIGIVKNEGNYEPLVDISEAEAEGFDVGIRLVFINHNFEQFHNQNINLNYVPSATMRGIVSLAGGFGCSGKVATFQEPLPKLGSGYDLRRLEYFAKGWENGPYRTNVVTGLAKAVQYNIDESKDYTVYAIVHNHYSEAGWGEYSNELATLFAIPKGDALNTTLLALLNKIGEAKGINVNGTAASLQ